MSDPIEAGIQRRAQEVLAAALRRIPTDGRWVVLHGDLARALLPHLPPRGERPVLPCNLTQPQEHADLSWGLGHVMELGAIHEWLEKASGRRLRWLAQVLDGRHRPNAKHPWVTIWIREEIV